MSSTTCTLSTSMSSCLCSLSMSFFFLLLVVILMLMWDGGFLGIFVRFTPPILYVGVLWIYSGFWEEKVDISITAFSSELCNDIGANVASWINGGEVS